MISSNARQTLTRSSHRRTRSIELHLSVLPSRDFTLIRQSQSRETKAIANIALGHSGILHGSEDLPAVVLGWAGHQTSRVPTVESVVGPRLAGDVGEAANSGVGRNAGRVGLGEAQSTVRVYVDLLTTGNFDILWNK